jgi:hypothetical protein
MAGDATEDPTEPPGPQDLDVDRTEESQGTPWDRDSASARAVGDILSGKATQEPRERSIIKEWSEEQNEWAAREAEAKLKEKQEAAERAAASKKKVDGAWNRLALVVILFLILGSIYGCGKYLGDDDETTGGSPDDSSLSEVDDAGSEGSAPTEGTVPDEVPEELKAARPLSGRVTGANTVVVDFSGDAKSLAESGDLGLLQVSVIVTDGPISVTMYYSIEDGVARQTAIRTDAADSVPTEDGGGTVTSGVSGPLEGVFTGPGELTLTASTFDLPPGAEVTVQSVLQQTGSGKMHVLDPE